jgi:hypothetical protein
MIVGGTKGVGCEDSYVMFRKGYGFAVEKLYWQIKLSNH